MYPRITHFYWFSFRPPVSTKGRSLLSVFRPGPEATGLVTWTSFMMDPIHHLLDVIYDMKWGCNHDGILESITRWRIPSSTWNLTRWNLTRCNHDGIYRSTPGVQFPAVNLHLWSRVLIQGFPPRPGDGGDLTGKGYIKSIQSISNMYQSIYIYI